MLETARMKGRAPSIALHLSPTHCGACAAPCITSEAGASICFKWRRCSGASEPSSRAGGREGERFSVEDFVQRMPDGFAIVDRAGVVRHANHTFLDLVQAGVESAVIGQNIKRWLSRPGRAFGLSWTLSNVTAVCAR